MTWKPHFFEIIQKQGFVFSVMWFVGVLFAIWNFIRDQQGMRRVTIALYGFERYFYSTLIFNRHGTKRFIKGQNDVGTVFCWEQQHISCVGASIKMLHDVIKSYIM